MRLVTHIHGQIHRNKTGRRAMQQVLGLADLPGLWKNNCIDEGDKFGKFRNHCGPLFPAVTMAVSCS